MEYVENGSLLSMLKEFGTLPEILISGYIDQVLSALVYLHSENIIHRDLKAANILLTKSGSVKLADFGVASALQEGNVRFSVAGSPYWMPPEMIEMTGVFPTSDIWSLGATVIELFTSEPPFFKANPMSAMFQIVQTGPEIPEDASEEMHDFLSLCFKKEPLERPQASVLRAHMFIKRLDQTDIESQTPRNVTDVRKSIMLYQRQRTLNQKSFVSAVKSAQIGYQKSEPQTIDDLKAELAKEKESKEQLQSKLLSLEKDYKELVWSTMMYIKSSSTSTGQNFFLSSKKTKFTPEEKESFRRNMETQFRQHFENEYNKAFEKKVDDEKRLKEKREREKRERKEKEEREKREKEERDKKEKEREKMERKEKEKEEKEREKEKDQRKGIFGHYRKSSKQEVLSALDSLVSIDEQQPSSPPSRKISALDLIKSE
eukprot:TRINITY_DN3523_c1_g1_i1.p1 TRINITY_DN3523_c1_g1~~TRINITY_DN3523_c1_g1_i1.p1  ORF type:complete len:430 (+),score=165.01 TRINITY_DN3523_c1_g1_i1:1384-2673(+)